MNILSKFFFAANVTCVGYNCQERFIFNNNENHVHKFTNRRLPKIKLSKPFHSSPIKTRANLVL